MNSVAKLGRLTKTISGIFAGRQVDRQKSSDGDRKGFLANLARYNEQQRHYKDPLKLAKLLQF